jgi:hypothetical protein
MSGKAGANELAFLGEKEQENQARVRWTWKPGRSVEMARMLNCGCRFRWEESKKCRKEEGATAAAAAAVVAVAVAIAVAGVNGTVGWWRMENAGDATRKGESAGERFWG